MPGLPGEPGWETHITLLSVYAAYASTEQPFASVTDGVGDSLPLCLDPSSTRHQASASMFHILLSVVYL